MLILERVHAHWKGGMAQIQKIVVSATVPVELAVLAGQVPVTHVSPTPQKQMVLAHVILATFLILT